MAPRAKAAPVSDLFATLAPPVIVPVPVGYASGQTRDAPVRAVDALDAPVAPVALPVLAMPPSDMFEACALEALSPADLSRPGFIEVASVMEDWRIGLTGQAGFSLGKSMHARNVIEALEVSGWLRSVPEKAAGAALAVQVSAPVRLQVYQLIRQILSAVQAGQLAPEPGTEDHLQRWIEDAQRILQHERDLARARGEHDV